MKKVYAAVIIGGVFLVSVLLFVSSCVPSYPKEKLPEAVKSVCKIEYGMDVDVTLVGATMGMYYAMEGLMDAGFGVSEKAWDTVSNLLLIASRVVLSTDADIKFYCVITQDVKLPEIQVVVIKFVDDIKYTIYQNISRDEAFKRTLFSLNLTPQAEKERSIDRIFEKLALEEGVKEKVMDEFFRSPPTRLSDVGYWRGNFYLKDITKEEFLAAQIASRIKLDFRNKEELMELFSFGVSEGAFITGRDSKFFLIKFKIAEQRASSQFGNLRLRKIRELVRIINEVIYGYKFQDFDYVALEDQLENIKLKVDEEHIYDFDKKKLQIEDIVQGPAGYF